jgi:DNA-binding MarR family transcriptional regulator
VTRLLDGLEGAGLVERGSCATDRRVVYAVLTDEGERRFRAAAVDHLSGIESALATRLGPDETAQLAALLDKLAAGGELACATE